MPFVPQRPQSTAPSSTLHVISVISNPVMYHSRYKLYREFETQMQRHNVNLITVEVAFGDRAFEVTQAGNFNHVQARTWDELWHKENMINLGLQRLPADWQYVAWIDADVQFVNPNWVEQTIHQLQHHHVIQLFSDCIDMGPEGQVIEHHKSFCHQYLEHGFDSILKADSGYYAKSGSKIAFPHPGYAWAARREAIDALGGLIDWAILGAGDHHMAWALVEHVEKSNPGGLHPNYLSRLLLFQDRCKEHIKKDIGYVSGTILHAWHGKKKDRRYQSRWKILQDHKFDPAVDIIKDSQGLWQLAGNKTALRDDLRKYFRSRDEDSTDLT
jgi:hypothetical protein